jgi:hypothetical protein
MFGLEFLKKSPISLQKSLTHAVKICAVHEVLQTVLQAGNNFQQSPIFPKEPYISSKKPCIFVLRRIRTFLLYMNISIHEYQFCAIYV